MWNNKWFLNIIVLLLIVGLAGMFLPDEYQVERSIHINAPPGEVYGVIVDLRKWEQWTVLNRMDPDVRLIFDGPDRAIGMRMRWEGTIVGRGAVEISSLQFNRQLIYSLSRNDDGVRETGEMRLVPLESGTELIWTSRGNVGVNIFDRYSFLFLESEVDEAMQVALENIKTLAENAPASSR
ncbi:SRPBCC family protein [Alteromonas gilva]|uniref:SRPBCC family protein n=1 Tax=Alteromonas gilva TaxID=2987522 RepID=A0ABT5L2P6_9ALTE|nr:SRPBCC family protein [Alteromonas gilva]MDC8831314.1 SRPBCC family protein [Alteromonas gilva]